MAPHYRRITILAIFLAPVLILFLFLPQRPLAQGRGPAQSPSFATAWGVTQQLTETTYLYMPFIPVNLGPEIALQWLQTFDAEGDLQAAFLPGEGFEYRLTAVNDRSYPITISLQVSHLGPCGTTLIYDGPLELPPGTTVHPIPVSGETCHGIYTATAEFSYKFLNGSLFNFFVVNPASTVVVNQQHGFDACHPPTVAEMQTWWDSSPYYVYNLYLGGSLFACDDEPLDPFWVHQVAGQGWEFILSWVGPQAPCTNFRERMSGDPTEAYQEGRAEAQWAVETAEQLGLLGNRVIYYDVEGYASASLSCRNAVSSFIEGWTDALHDLGFQAGAYGGACSSYLADWAGNSPPPDDVWIAHWSESSYEPDATVWDAPCLSNNLWDDHQRIKQYAGGHNETWGDVTVNIDSDVLDGEVTRIPFGVYGGFSETPAATLTFYGVPWQDVGLWNPSLGWARTEARLWVTADGGVTWDEISPGFSRLMDVGFIDEDQLWAVGLRGGQGGLSLAWSVDRGRRWDYRDLSELEAGPSPVADAVLDVSAPGRPEVAIQRASGSNFYLGEIYRSEDRGGTWRMETAISGRDAFLVAGDQAADAENRPFDLPTGAVAADFAGPESAWAIVQQGDCAGDKTGLGGLNCVRSWQLLATEDAGNTWFALSPNE